MNAANSISLKSFLLNSADVFDGDIKIEKTAMTDAEISNAQDMARGSLEKNSRTVRLPTKLSTPASINPSTKVRDPRTIVRALRPTPSNQFQI